MRKYNPGMRPPDLRARNPAALLDLELAHERACSLGRLGRALEAALRELADFDDRHPRFTPIPQADRQARSALVSKAAHALWNLTVQREACGLSHTQTMMDDYHVPADVQRMMGAMDEPECATA